MAIQSSGKFRNPLQWSALVHLECIRHDTVPHLLMSTNYPYIVRCNDCDFVSQVFLDEKLALDERDFHSFEHLHSVSIWRYAWENWTVVTELLGISLR